MATKRIFGAAAMLAGATLVLQILVVYKTSTCNVGLSRLHSRLQSGDVSDGVANRNFYFSRQVLQKTEVVNYFPDTHNRRKRYLTIGIPTIKRRDGYYFLRMLSSMLNETSEADLQQIVFVVFLAENDDQVWKNKTKSILKSKFSDYIDKGSLIIIQPPLEFYDSMPEFGNNSYMKWRTKQNFDYAFLMKFSQHLSTYYMQMEDDVITSDGYYSAITEYIDKQPEGWVCLEFSELGFIGKLYHSSDIGNLADMLLIFNTTQPVDYTFIYFNILSGQVGKHLRIPTLFQHIGVNSSLAFKIQELRDKYFDLPKKELKGDNPKAKIFTSFKTNTDFPPEMAYGKENGHFWSASNGVKGDHFTILFNTSHSISSVVVLTGSKYYPHDMIHNGIVQTSPYSINENGKECSNYFPLGVFKEGIANITSHDIAAKHLSMKSGCLQILLTESQPFWVIIKEIAVFLS